jgi:hypothetical protein
MKTENDQKNCEMIGKSSKYYDKLETIRAKIKKKRMQDQNLIKILLSYTSKFTEIIHFPTDFKSNDLKLIFPPVSLVLICNINSKHQNLD